MLHGTTTGVLNTLKLNKMIENIAFSQPLLKNILSNTRKSVLEYGDKVSIERKTKHLTKMN